MPSNLIRIGVAQINPTVGDIDGNVTRILSAYRTTAELGADLTVFSELVVSGYPPEDLVTRPAYLAACRDALELLAANTRDGQPMLVGTPWPGEHKPNNAAVLLADGELAAVSCKYHLPNYGVFDEQRVFAQSPLPTPIDVRDLKLGVLICEDFWTAEVPLHLLEQGAQLLVAINASPFNLGKWQQRAEQARRRAAETGCALVYVNQVGGQDELVFDGSSFIVDAGGAEIVRYPAFRECVSVIPCELSPTGAIVCSGATIHEPPDELESIYAAMVLGLRDYVEKNRFPGVLVGLSGGIDSALTAAVAVDALGAEHVSSIMMPSPYTSDESLVDAKRCAESLGTRYDVVPIEPAMLAFDSMLAELFKDLDNNVTEENIQSRIRGLLLMAMSNKFGLMLLTTGNKSEMATGYATLYGDMCGGYSVLKDVYKTTVFELARWRNARIPTDSRCDQSEVIPERIITKPPSAELRPDQKDTDSLPDYEQLDGILECLIEADLSVDETIRRGYDQTDVVQVARLLAIAEYKRRQAPPGVKITRRAFSRERRYPITSGYREST